MKIVMEWKMATVMTIFSRMSKDKQGKLLQPKEEKEKFKHFQKPLKQQ